MEIIKPNININFVGKIWYALIISWVLISIGLVSLVVKGGPHYGVDFKGGTLFQVRFNNPTSAGDIRQMVKDMGIEAGSVQNFGEGAIKNIS